MADSISFQDYTNRGERNDRLKVFSDKYIKIGRDTCPRIWQRIVITWDGKVIMCCRNWNSENVLGMLNYDEGKDIEYFWKGKELDRIRRLHLEGRLNEVLACSKCSFMESFLWKKIKITEK